MQSVTTSQEKMTQENAPFLLIEDVSKVYPTPNGPYTVLEGVNLTVAEGEFVCIIGHSGCGKSTLLNMVAGFNQPSQGEVRLQAQPITQPGPDRMMVFQNYSLLPWKTAFENVYLAVNSVYPDKPKAEKIALVEEHLAMVGLTEAAHKKPQQLSGGMKQRVAIARALASEPKVLLMDEPFGALDVHTKESMHEFMLDLWQRTNITIFTITHDVEEAVFLSNRIYALGSRPGTVRREISINLPDRSQNIKRHSLFHDYCDELMDLMRRHGREAFETKTVVAA